MIKKQTIEQLQGFGSDQPATAGEHYKSSAFTKRTYGMANSGFVKEVYTDNSLDNITTIFAFTTGLGRTPEGDTVETNSLYAIDTNNLIYKSNFDYSDGIESVVEPFKVAYKTLANAKGLITDPKKRILYPQTRYLGMYDPTVANYKTGSVSVTNGSATVTGNGTTFTASMATNKRGFRILGEDKIYKISAYTSATQITLSEVYTGTTNVGQNYIIYEAWTDEWKDFGASLADTSLATTAYIDCETYEDTVLFGRNNVIHSLSVTTDTINTSAFALPSGFDILKVESGSNGILVVTNFRKQGVLILWDNYSDRSIAPWIYLNEPILGVSKYTGGWIVQTTHKIFYTNGYSITPIKEEYLGTSLEGTDLPITQFYPYQTEITANNFYFKSSIPTTGKRRQGLYKINLDSTVMEYYPIEDRNSYGIDITALKYDSDNLLVGIKSGGTLGNCIGKLEKREVSPVSSITTYEIGENNNEKIAEGIDLFLGVDSQYRSTGLSNISFTISAKIADPSRQIFHQAVVKTTSVDRTYITVDGTVYGGARVGDEVEFLNGGNAGYTRHITAISGNNTDTEIWTLNTEAPTAIEADVVLNVSPFRLVDTITFQDLETIDEVYFEVKEKLVVKKAIIKIEILDCSVPLELKGIDFIYEDMGIKI